MTERRRIKTNNPTNVVKLSPPNNRKDKNGSIRPTAFKPGQSGNPIGRPKVPAEFQQLMKEYSVDAAQKLHDWMMSNDPKISPAVCMYILNRAYGMPTQMTELSGPNGGPLAPPSLSVNFVAAPSKTIDA